jgi:hypothetical protein
VLTIVVWTANYIFGKMGLAHLMSALFNSDASRDSRPISPAPTAPPSPKIDWHDARSEYDQSVADLLAAIQRCSTLPLSDAEKCLLIETAREREQTAFVKYKRALDAS